MKKRKELQKKRLDNNTSCEELMTDECSIRFDSCSFSTSEQKCMKITPEQFRKISDDITLCNATQGIYEANRGQHACVCPSIEVPKTLQQLQSGMNI
jgi:hypothetical protein